MLLHFLFVTSQGGGVSLDDALGLGVSSVINIVEGSTNNIRFQLLESGVAIDLTGYTVTLLLSDKSGLTVTSPGTVSVTDATNGKVQLAPTSAATFVAAAGPYYARWKLVDGSGHISFVPTSNRDSWTIVGQ